MTLFSSLRGRTLRVGAPTSSTAQARASGAPSRIAARVAGEVLWFESEHELLPRPESFLAPAALAARERGQRIVSDAPVDPVWLANARALHRVHDGWWGAQPGFLLEAVPEAAHAARAPGDASPHRRAAGTGLCFTGGVDSFYALAERGSSVTHLFFVVGYDFSLDDTRAHDVATMVKQVAEAHGCETLFVRTNLRSHRLVRRPHWDRAHGVALAAAAYPLQASIELLLVPPSWAPGRYRPWGSHPETEPLLSTSRLRVEHVVGPRRFARTSRIVDLPEAQRNLRVCWQNVPGRWNCGTCSKCLRTRIYLAALGALERFPTFLQPESLVSDLDRLERLSPVEVSLFTDVPPEALPAAVRGAFERLLARSPRPSATEGTQ